MVVWGRGGEVAGGGEEGEGEEGRGGGEKQRICDEGEEETESVRLQSCEEVARERGFIPHDLTRRLPLTNHRIPRRTRDGPSISRTTNELRPNSRAEGRIFWDAGSECDGSR